MSITDWDFFTNLHQCSVSSLWAEATKARKVGEQQQKKLDLDLGSHCGADLELILFILLSSHLVLS